MCSDLIQNHSFSWIRFRWMEAGPFHTAAGESQHCPINEQQCSVQITVIWGCLLIVLQDTHDTTLIYGSNSAANSTRQIISMCLISRLDLSWTVSSQYMSLLLKIVFFLVIFYFSKQDMLNKFPCCFWILTWLKIATFIFLTYSSYGLHLLFMFKPYYVAGRQLTQKLYLLGIPCHKHPFQSFWFHRIPQPTWEALRYSQAVMVGLCMQTLLRTSRIMSCNNFRNSEHCFAFQLVHALKKWIYEYLCTCASLKCNQEIDEGHMQQYSNWLSI